MIAWRPHRERIGRCRICDQKTTVMILHLRGGRIIIICQTCVDDLADAYNAYDAFNPERKEVTR